MSSDVSLVSGAISVLKSTPAVLRAMLGPLPADLIAVEGKGGWSARDVVAHLSVRQRAAIVGRITAVLAEPGATLPQVPQQLMDVTPYRSRPLDELFREFEEGRAEAVGVVEQVTPEELQLRGVHTGVGEVSIAEIVHHLAFHDLVHISQAADLALAPLEPLRGAMRRFR